MPTAGSRIGDARNHVRSARLLAAHDRNWLAATRPGKGAHRVLLLYARHVLSKVVSAEDLTEAEGIRRDRGLAEYGDYPSTQFTVEHVKAAADVAERVVNTVATELARMAWDERS